mmetsp:Transcript_23133/g.38116  ORF Transcript_23133/g.38116 Transcript_23133/m.38116 type:complete len:93 (+) Transcript_23133:1400-1678(+)
MFGTDRYAPRTINNPHSKHETNGTTNCNKETCSHDNTTSVMNESLAALEHNIEKQLSTHKPNEDREKKPPELQCYIEWEEKPNKLSKVFSNS